MTPAETKPAAYEGWSIVELMGHRRLAGMVSEAEVFGTKMLRIDVYLPAAAAPMATQFYSASALYAVTPTTEAIARQVAAQDRPAPVAQWELPAAGAAREAEPDAEGDEEGRDERPF